MNAALTYEWLQRMELEQWRRAFELRPVVLYDQFGRPVYVPSSAKKIGDTITVKRPERYK